MTTANPNTEFPATQSDSTGRTSHYSPDTRELNITRIFDAPRELVFKAWTESDRLAQWWSPKYFTNPVCEVDARPGGAILVHMADPDGNVYPMKGEYNEIVPPERIVMTTVAIADGEGNPLLENITTVTFEEHGDKTKLTLHVVVMKAIPEAAGALAGMEEGWNQSLDKLADLVSNV